MTLIPSQDREELTSVIGTVAGADMIRGLKYILINSTFPVILQCAYTKDRCAGLDIFLESEKVC
jgi:hypothetical protein